jgi:hypothetical protein
MSPSFSTTLFSSELSYWRDSYECRPKPYNGDTFLCKRLNLID